MALEYWPYEETSFELVDAAQGRFVIRTLWMESQVIVEPGSPNFELLAAYARDGEAFLAADPVRLGQFSEILGTLEALPISYRLPRLSGSFGVDRPPRSGEGDLESPLRMAKSLGIHGADSFEADWSWDAKAALDLSALQEPGCAGRSHDPWSVLSVARRFHYLDCSDNKMQEVYDSLKGLRDPAAREEACAWIVRQNHYVTEKCESSLAPARQIAGSASGALEDFIRAERGHDRLLDRSLQAMGFEALSLPVTPSVRSLMELLRRCGELSFLAFCLSLEFFERPQFREKDTLAEALIEAGKGQAAKGLQIHKDINDGGSHESVAKELLAYMKPVSGEYALQALRLAELVSSAIAGVPYDLEKMIRGRSVPSS